MGEPSSSLYDLYLLISPMISNMGWNVVRTLAVHGEGDELEWLLRWLCADIFDFDLDDYDYEMFVRFVLH